MVIKQNTIVFIILVLLIAIAIVIGVSTMRNSPLDSAGVPCGSRASGASEGFVDEAPVFTVTQGLSPSLQLIFENQRDSPYRLDKVCSSGSCYNIRTDIDGAAETARIFGEIDLMIEQLTYCLQTKYIGRPERVGAHGETIPAKPPKVPGDDYRTMITQNILDRYKKENMIENSTRNRTLTSFVTDKGRLFAICTRGKGGTGKHHSLALLKFVALHELAHIANSMPGTENHGPEFWRTFKMLLLEAKDNGLCTKLTTESGTITYCNGLKMTDSNLSLDKVRV